MAEENIVYARRDMQSDHGILWCCGMAKDKIDDFIDWFYI